MNDKFVLDDKSFKALSAESRVSILKNLNNRRMTLSELSKKLSLKNSTIKEHCELLMGAELVKKIDDGRKWKYYELTYKGKKIIAPNPFDEVKVLIMLSSTIVFSAIIILILMQSMFVQQSFSSDFAQNNLEQINITSNDLLKTERVQNPEMMTSSLDEASTITGINYNFFAISVITSLIIGIFSGWIVSRKI